MEITARTLQTKILTITMTATALCVVAVFVYSANLPVRAASKFLNAVHREDWKTAYSLMGPLERKQLNMNPNQFVAFCSKIAEQGWPRQDTTKFEEMIPYTAPTAHEDTTWSIEGTHRYSVTFYRPDGASDIHATMDYRHLPSGGWYMDVLPFILMISRGVPHGHPVLALFNAMTAAHLKTLEEYPHHEHTDLATLSRVMKAHKGYYLTTRMQFLN